MTYQENKSIVNIISSILITTIYALIIYRWHMDGRFDLTTDYSKWGIIFLAFIGISVVARIIIYIIFHIINAIATREEDVPVEDERDKLISLKATRISYYVFIGGFSLSFVSLTIGMPVYGLIIAFFACGFLGEMAENISQIIYYRKGI